jgi:hypothetical protein
MKTKLYTVLIALFVAPGAIAKTVQVGGCLPALQTFPTISDAASGVASGSTILVCPGTYPEQVVITQPLTLRGVQSANAGKSVITSPPGGLKKSVLAGGGVQIYYQLLAQGTTSSPINISNIAIDGANNAVPAPSAVVGVYYQNSSGTLRNVAIYNQMGSGAGYGVILENTNATPISVSVLGSAIHDFDQGGIQVVGNIASTIKSNEINTSTGPSGIILNAGGIVANNRVNTHVPPPGTSSGVGINVISDATITNNTVEGFTVGIWPLGTNNTVNLNKVSLASSAVVVSGSANTIQHNSFLHIFSEAIHFNCTGTANVVTHNIINDSFWGIIDDDGTNVITPNSYFNVTRLISPPC